MPYNYTSSEYVETYGYPYYLFYRYSAGSTVYEHRYYTTEKFRVDYQEDNRAAIIFRSEWVDGRGMAYYLQVYRNGIFYREETDSVSYIRLGSFNNFEILGANYDVTLLDGVTVVYSPPRKKEPIKEPINWIKIYNPNLTLLAVVAKVIKPTITEELNGAYTFDFEYVIDDEKSQYMQVGNIVEVENNYFRICYTEESRNADDTMTISVSCEHVVYDLIEHELDYYTVDGTATQMLETLLSDTDFTVGDVDTSEVKTVSIQEKQNKKDILYAIASVFGLELKFEKFKINLVKRGSDNGVQFRYRRNIKGITRIVDGRNKIDGQPSVAYELDAVMLEQLFGETEHFELGDTVRVYDEGLGIDITTRIVKMSYDIEERMTADVEIANFIPNVTDTLTQIERTTVHKEKIYNGVVIGPENGFVAERSDKMARNTMNATFGNMLELGDGEGNYTPVFYVAVDPADGKAKLYLAGDAVFTGLIEASDIVGGSINIGEGTFTVDSSGNVEANSGVFRGSLDGAGGTFRGDLNAKDIIIGENNQDNGSINIRMEDYFITAKIAKIAIAGGTTITTLFIGKTTEEGSTPLNNIGRVDLLAGTLYVYNNIYANGSINAASGKIGGVDIATHTWVDNNYLDKLTAAALASKNYVDDAIAAHVAEYHAV